MSQLVENAAAHSVKESSKNSWILIRKRTTSTVWSVPSCLW